jgi:hypothetical protein
MLEENNIKIRKKLKKLSKNLDKNYYEILNIYKELIIQYYEYNKMD